MKRRTTIVLISAAVLATAAGAFYWGAGPRARANVEHLVARALTQDANTSYIAKVVTTIRYNGKVITTHATVFHQGRTEKVEYAGPAGRQVWSMTKDAKSYTYLPKGNRLLVSETGRLLSDADRTGLLLRNYRAVSGGTDSVAGRDAYVVNISSRHDGRPSKKLWIDKARFTVLKSIDYSAAGDERGRMEIKQVRYDARIRPDTFAIPADKSVNVVKVCESSESLGLYKTLGMHVVRPRYLPAGYESEGHRLFNSQCNCDHRSAQLTYTDGLNVISVFQTPRMTCCKDGACDMADCGKGGGCAVANRGVARTGVVARTDRTVVVVGDMLPREIKRVAESVR